MRQGFEPWVPFKGYNALAKRRFRPLSHLTNCGAAYFEWFASDGKKNSRIGPGFLTQPGKEVRNEICFLSKKRVSFLPVFPLISIACFMAGSFIVLTRVLLFGLAVLTADADRRSGED